jgi:hypothetical protein
MAGRVLKNGYQVKHDDGKAIMHVGARAVQF